MSDLVVGPPGLPELDPSAIADHPEAAPEPSGVGLQEDPEVPEAAVRAALAAAGGLAGHWMGDKRVPGHWRFTADELDDMTPPVTRMVNGNPRLRAVVGRVDALTAGMVLIRYITRNLALTPQEEDLEPSIRSGHLIAGSTAATSAPAAGGATAAGAGPGGPYSPGGAARPDGVDGGPVRH